VDKYADSETSNDLNPSSAVVKASVLAGSTLTVTGTATPDGLFTLVKVEAYFINLTADGRELGHRR
jgi:hypothetical protein